MTSIKMKIKKSDQVILIAGKDKGKVGKVLKVIPSESRVVVSGVNIVKKHCKATRESPAQIKSFEASVHISNVMLIDSASGKPTRVFYDVRNGEKVRLAKKTGSVV
jgi:large subunit ribosomal protein L24